MKGPGEPGLVSIVIPTFNRGSLLPETLASALAQTYRPIELVVVDDGSTDNTRAVVDEWGVKAERDSNATIRYFHQSNTGVGSARNLGLIESRGEYIQFLDSDDLLHPRKLELQIACLHRFPESGYAFSRMVRLEDPIKWDEISQDQATLMESAEFFCSPLMLTMVGVYRRQTCRDAGPWSEDIMLGEDEEYNFRALLSTPKLVHLPGYLCAFRDHCGPRLTDVQKHRRGLNVALRAYGRMAKFAASHGYADDPRLVTPLAQRLTSVIVGSMELGLPEVAAEAIEACRELPVTIGRRVRLSIYEMLNHLPPGTFPKIWGVWLKFRKALADKPKRAA